MWIHRGVCGFAQQGCKYKHEMPFDRQTQASVGLFQGLPEWYKKANAIQLLPAPFPPPTRKSNPIFCLLLVTDKVGDLFFIVGHNFGVHIILFDPNFCQKPTSFALYIMSTLILTHRST